MSFNNYQSQINKPIVDKKEILPLTFFRFVTAFMVFLFHVRIYFNLDLHAALLNSAISQGAVFMTAFFILSGFVLRYAYRGVDLLETENLKNYYLRRFAKIYPSYLAVVAIAYVLAPFNGSLQMIASIPMQILGLQSLFYTTFDLLINGALWSLSVEIFFYVLFPFINRLLSWHKTHTWGVYLGCYLLSLYPSAVHAIWGPTYDLYINPVFRLPEFLAGMCLANFYFAQSKNKSKSQFSGVFAITALVILLLIVGLLDSRQFLNNANFHRNYSYYTIVTIPLLSYIIYHMARMSDPILTRLTNNRVCIYLGKISYAFYLTQFIAIGYFGLKHHSVEGWPQSQMVVVLFVINFVCAVALYELVEKRVRKVLLG